ncbi:hypothetical protein [Catenulispora acidiphila]|uniref:hypothetical protein n=1 Tax=Catenulispora acidiphila TaxID=304895 RepID=UPI001CBD36FE|nr:hypothetical protein [Catenulispora acidiphila]
MIPRLPSGLTVNCWAALPLQSRSWIFVPLVVLRRSSSAHLPAMPEPIAHGHRTLLG